NELCRLGIPEDAVSIHSVRTALLQEGRWPDLTTLLDAELGVGVARTWFWHFNRLRATALYGELPELLKNAAPSKPEDKIYLSVNPNDPKSVRHDPKLELGTYSRDKFDHMYELIEKIDLVLASLIGQNLIQL
ncbi:MAG: hypothetical protein ABIK44_03445, partial [candidate division WOR-3 bacterium]